MEVAALMVWAGSSCAVMGVLLLRAVWGRACRSSALNIAAWGLLLIAAVLGAAGHGAWGLAICTIAGMGTASLVLAHAAMRSPAGKARATIRRARAEPERVGPMRLGRRFLTFLLAVPVSLVAALIFAIGLRALVSLFGWSQADMNGFALLAMPLAWGLLLVQMLMTDSRRGQLFSLMLPAAAGCMLFVIGGGA